MRSLFSLPTSALTLVALGILNTASAEENTLNLPSTSITSTADDEAPQGYQAKPSATTTRLNLTAGQTPQGISSIKREQMDDFKLNSIRDIMDSTPGVNVQKVETDRTYFTPAVSISPTSSTTAWAWAWPAGCWWAISTPHPMSRWISCTAPTG